MLRRILMLVALLSAGAQTLHAQQIPDWTLYLAGHEVRDIVEHGDVAYFATSRGVARWDHATGTMSFFEKPDEGLRANPVNSVSIDSTGLLWITWGGNYERSGISHYQGRTSWIVQRTGTSGLGPGPAYDIAVGADGTIWSSLWNGGVARLGSDRRWTPVTTDPNLMVPKIAVDARDRLWALVPYQGVWRRDGATWTTFSENNTTLPNHQVGVIEPDTAGGVWVGTSQGLTHISDTGSATYSVAAGDLGSDWIRGLAHDRYGALWVLTDSGLVRHDGLSWTRVALPAGSARPTTLARSWNGLWIGTARGAYHFNGTEFRHVSTAKTPIPDDYVQALAVDRAGDLWASLNGHVMRFDGTTWHAVDSSDHGFGRYGFADGVVDRTGALWLLSGGGGVSRYDGTTWRHWPRSQFIRLGGQAITVDRSGTIWLAAQTVYSFDGTAWTHHPRFDPLDGSSMAYAVTADSSGGVWIGTYGAGVHRYRDGVWTVDTPFASWVSAMVTDAAGNVHVGYNGARATFDGASWTVLTAQKGDLPFDDIEAMLPLADGAFWYGFSGWSGNGHGAAVLRGGRWTVFPSFGGPLPDGNVTALVQGRDGAIWIGTREGLARWLPVSSSAPMRIDSRTLEPSLSDLVRDSSPR